MVVVLVAGLPEEAKQWEFELFSPVFPVIIDDFGELLGVIHLEELLVLLVEVVHHPALVPGQVHALPSHHLHLHDRLLQELARQDVFPPELEPILVGLHEGVVHFGQLVPIGHR